MKKSKIIVPALALIAFSTAASITGTVAWFTASRTATFNAGTYNVASTAKGLSYSLTGAIGTTDSSHTSVSMTANYHLTDGSFDHANKLIFAPAQDGHSLADTSGVALGSATVSNMTRSTVDSDVYLTVATFTLSVSMDFGETGKSQALLLDKANSWFKEGNAAPDKAGKGFRLAIVGTTADVTSTKVLGLADLEENSKYISASNAGGAAGSFTAGGDSYASGLIASDTTVTLPADGANTKAQSAALNNYLGLFTFTANQKVTINFTCVAWYEGTHSEVVDANIAAGLDEVTVQIGLAAVATSD